MKKFTLNNIARMVLDIFAIIMMTGAGVLLFDFVQYFKWKYEGFESTFFVIGYNVLFVGLFVMLAIIIVAGVLDLYHGIRYDDYDYDKEEVTE